MTNIKETAVLGAGVIGASWTALFLATEKSVAVYDPMDNAEDTVKDYIENAAPALVELGLSDPRKNTKLTFHSSPETAVQNADFIQENVPERIEVKHEVYAKIEPYLRKDAIVASSASGLLVKEMQNGWKDPSRFILGHPFNPPHLIPLVELLGNDKTADGVLDAAKIFYEDMGKVTIQVNKELPGHVANRLQAALWREAIYLVETGAASVEDVDKAVWAGPGLRWAAMGPHMLFHLGAGKGGIKEFCERYTPSFTRWWKNMGTPNLSPKIADDLNIGIEAEMAGRSIAEGSAKRDEIIIALLKASKNTR